MTKPFDVSKKVVWEAYLKVKEKKGAAGVDEISIQEFEKNLKDNLYKLWNRMSSGSYFPLPVRAVSIPKSDGGTRILGIPSVSDRIAQMVVVMYLQPLVEPDFHTDSYGYRPNKSAIEAVKVARQRSWYYDWAIDLDIKGFFDNLNHNLVMRAVQKYTSCKWILLYIERWQKASIQKEDGTIEARNKGVPQGGVISPLLANIFMNLAFDKWMNENFPEVPFERYADDVIVHCRTEKQANFIKDKIKERLERCKLELHPVKTKVVYCKDGKRKGTYQNENFDFLGFTFRPRLSKNHKGEYFVNFSPAISKKAKKRICTEINSWRIHMKVDKSLNEIADMVNPVVRGWINYYGSFYKSAINRPLRHVETYLVRWANKKFKKFKKSQYKARRWLGNVEEHNPELFAHWKIGLGSAVR